MHRLFVNIVLDREEVRVGRVRSRDDILDDVLRDLVRLGGGVEVVFGVKVKVRDVVTELGHCGLAGSGAR